MPSFAKDIISLYYLSSKHLIENFESNEDWREKLAKNVMIKTMKIRMLVRRIHQMMITFHF